MKKLSLTYQQIQDSFPQAWRDLPICYQETKCLSFFLDKFGRLWAEHTLGGFYLWCGKRENLLGSYWIIQDLELSNSILEVQENSNSQYS